MYGLDRRSSAGGAAPKNVKKRGLWENVRMDSG